MGKIQALAKKNSENYEATFNFIPRDNYLSDGRNDYPDSTASKVSPSVWPVVSANSTSTKSDKENMPYSEIFWSGKKVQYNNKLNGVKGCFTMLPAHWTEGENNLIPYNMRLIAINSGLKGNDLQITDIFQKDDRSGVLL